jgi:hypothetical protein
METFKQTFKQAQTKINYYLQKGLDNPYVMAILKITVIMYAAQLAPKLPQGVSNVLNNTFAKIFILFTILYIAEKDFQLAIIIAIAYVIGTNLLSGRDFLESFGPLSSGKKNKGSVEPFAPFSKQYEHNSSAKIIDPQLDVYPGCHSITMDDLLVAFQNDHIKLQENVQYAYQQLLNSAQTKDNQKLLELISKATGLPHNIEFTDENAPYIATLLINQGFEFSESCQPPQ